MNDIALKTMLFMTSIVLLPNSLPVVGSKAEFVHEGDKSYSGSCRQAPFTAQELPCYGVVTLRAPVSVFPSVGNREKQWEQGKGNGALELCKKYPDWRLKSGRNLWRATECKVQILPAAPGLQGWVGAWRMPLPTQSCLPTGHPGLTESIRASNEI